MTYTIGSPAGYHYGDCFRGQWSGMTQRRLVEPSMGKNLEASHDTPLRVVADLAAARF